jgi:hypothetical protein
MNLITINEQIERYAQMQQAMSRAQAQYVTTTGPVFTAMYKEANILVKEMHQAFKNYKKDVFLYKIISMKISLRKLKF